MLPYPTLPYPTLPYPTLPYPSAQYTNTTQHPLASHPLTGTWASARSSWARSVGSGCAAAMRWASAPRPRILSATCRLNCSCSSR